MIEVERWTKKTNHFDGISTWKLAYIVYGMNNFDACHASKWFLLVFSDNIYGNFHGSRWFICRYSSTDDGWFYYSMDCGFFVFLLLLGFSSQKNTSVYGEPPVCNCKKKIKHVLISCAVFAKVASVFKKNNPLFGFVWYFFDEYTIDNIFWVWEGLKFKKKLKVLQIWRKICI